MNTRLKQFLAAENISQAQLADTIKVVRASVSHVLSGRNNPSYEFMRAIMLAYPNLNIEWLMIGKGKMYKDSQMQTEAPIPTNLFFDHYDQEEAEETLQESIIAVQEPASEASTQTSNDINTVNQVAQTIVKQRNVSKIIIMFDDGTFQEM